MVRLQLLIDEWDEVSVLLIEEEAPRHSAIRTRAGPDWGIGIVKDEDSVGGNCHADSVGWYKKQVCLCFYYMKNFNFKI